MSEFLHPIKGQPFFNLEPYIDLQGLRSIEKDIYVGFAKARGDIVEGGAAGTNFLKDERQKNKISLQDISWKKVIEDPSNPNYEYYKELGFDEYACRFFNRYAENTIQLGQVLELRSFRPGNYHLKHLYHRTGELPHIKHFPKLMQWIKNLKIFSEYGKIMFVFNSPYDQHVIHRDMHVGHTDNFLLINLNPFKKDFFILDKDNNEHTVDCNAFVFDTRNYHGTRGKENYSWTLRIDGVFDRDWLKSIGMDDHFEEIKVTP